MDDLRITGDMQTRLDNWQNVITGMGTAADKSRHTHAVAESILSDIELEDIYIDDGLGARIVDTIPDDMFRQGWEFEFDDIADETEQKEKAQVFIDAFDELKIKTQLCYGYKWAGLYGGAIAIIGALDGRQLDKPLNIKGIREWDEMRIVACNDISFANIKFQLDPIKKRYLKPELYPVKFETGLGTKEEKFVHYSRIIELHGKQVPEGDSRRLSRERRYWGLSKLQSAYDILSTVGGSFASISQLLHQVSVGKYKLKDLVDILTAPDGDKAIQKRIEAMDLMQSVFHSIFLDIDEEFVRETISFTGVADVIYQFFMMLSADTGIPITRLFGVSPAGLNSTGENDQLNYYDAVSARQETELAPQLRYLVHIIAEKEGIEEPNVVFKPLKQMTDKEKADMKKVEQDTELVKMQRYQGYIDMGVMQAYQVEHIEFGDSLQEIPVPKDLEMPAVQELDPITGLPIAAPPPEIDLAAANSGDLTGDEDAPDEKTGDDPDASDSEAIASRIAELQAIDERTEEEEEELQDLLAQQKAKDGQE